VIKFIDKQETIDRFKEEHKRLKELVFSLSENKILKPKTLGEWSIKDIIAHLAAWNWEAIDETYRVLKNQATWPVRYEDKAGEYKFNKSEVKKRKGMTWEQVFKDWDESFLAQIKLMEKITEDEWKHQSSNQFWSDSTPVTVYSLYAYEYEGEGHEGGHAIQIKKFLNKV